MSNELKVTISGGAESQRQELFEALERHLRSFVYSRVGRAAVTLRVETDCALESFSSEHGRPAKDGEANLGSVAGPHYPDGNPKTTLGMAKLPLNLVPPVAVQHLALAFRDGAVKYGPYNWRDARISSTVYYAAALRHLFAWADGEDAAEDSGVHHLAHAMACCAIVLDAASIGKLNDNRPTAGAAAAMQKENQA